MQSKSHWERVYSTKATTAVSWFQEHAQHSLSLIRDTEVPLSASIIDVGGGASTLVDDLLENGYSKITVLDLSSAALAAAKTRLDVPGNSVQWLEADITKTTLPACIRSYP